MDAQRLKEFEYIFYPKSIAIVGASRDVTKFGTGFFRALLAADFKGRVYAVNPSGGKVLGVDSYANLRDIPDPVDYVIVSIPAKYIPALLDDCVAKGVKAVQMFTAGFKELGTEEGRKAEEALVRKAQEGGFHIIGPNCIGVCNPEINMPYGMSPAVGEPGSVGFISQSGGVGGKILNAGLIKGIHFSKIVSFGNGNELDSVDYLEYLGEDPRTEIIGMYLEGVGDGRRLFRLLREISATKPVVIWKGGQTFAGAEAASSHTGSLASSDEIWTALSKQLGIVKVSDADELADALLTLQHLRRAPGKKVGIVSGIMGGGGGESVSGTDTCSMMGLDVLPFMDETRNQLQSILPDAGAILRNPLDLGSIGHFLDILEKAMALVAADANVDVIIIQEPLDHLIAFLGKEHVKAMNDILIRLKQEQPKSVFVVSPTEMPSAGQVEIEQILSKAGIPVCPTLARAAKAIVNVNRCGTYRVESA